METKEKPREIVEALTVALADGDEDESISLLAALWPHLSGSDETGMADHKVDRAEGLVFEPPLVRFVVERHGAMVGGGSGRAELQGWVVDLEKLTAGFSTAGHRQMRPMEKALKVDSIADEISAAVLKGQQQPYLNWRTPDDVQLLMGAVIPDGSAVKQTLAGRRKRLRLKLGEILASHGWVQIRPNRFQRKS